VLKREGDAGEEKIITTQFDILLDKNYAQKNKKLSVLLGKVKLWDPR
jgi:hypothetical protein